ncbi:MAG: hypothetical protein HYU64_07315, partial [Armatimonadetes bacterium]|nr:hypothetical protein [Armatimonadota bacterium]
MTHKHHKSAENGVREISCAAITETVARLCCEANVELPDDFRRVMAEALDREISSMGKE